MAGESRVGLIGEAGFAPADEAGAGVDVAADAAGHGTDGSGAEAGEREGAACEGEGAGAGVGGAGVAGAAADAGAAGEDADPEAEAAARELAEHNALADVFDDVRRMSADSHLVTPDRWPAIGLVPDHMTAEDFEMFVYEWLEDYQAEHSDEIAAEIAAEKAKAASVRSATHAVGVPPKIPNRRLAQIEADNAAEQNKEAAAGEAAAEGGKAAPDDAVATAADSTGDSSLAAAGVSDVASSGSVEREDAAVASISAPADAAGGESGPAAAAPVDAAAASAANDNSPFAGLKIPEGYRLEQIEGEWVLVEDEDAAPVRKEIRCNRIKVLMGMHSYYLYDQTLMTDNYARWAFLAAEDNPQVTFVECVREDSRVYPRPYAAECLRNPPFSMTDEQIQQTWEAVRDSGNYPDIERTVASNGDVYYYSTDYLSADYAESLAEYDAVERPANV